MAKRRSPTEGLPMVRSLYCAAKCKERPRCTTACKLAVRVVAESMKQPLRERTET